MSGGVDSTLAAALLQREGYTVHGITMLMHDAGLGTVAAARSAAATLGIPLIEKDAATAFQQTVLAPFFDSYLHGLTPNPCLLCNPNVKFQSLLAAADEMGIACIATGHYVRVAQSRSGRWAIRRAEVGGKDQSYALAGLRTDQVARCVFPLGNWVKDDVRAEARRLGLEAADRSDSQDICFLPEGDYAGYLRTRGVSTGPGPIMNRSGAILGRHSGLEGYTVGQRKGLGIAAERPLYVLALDAAANTLVVGFEEETFSPELRAGPVNWMGESPDCTVLDCRVQIRYRHEAAPARVTHRDGIVHVEFEHPQRSVTPGQWAVAYDEAGCILFGAPILPA